MALRVFLKQVVENGKVIHPRRFKLNCKEHEGYTYPLCVECLKSKKPAFELSCQYYNNPIDESSVEFKQAWVQPFEYTEDLIKKLDKVGSILSIDPAVTFSKSSDYYGFVITKVVEGNFVYVLEAAQKKFSPEDAIQQIFRYIDQYKVSTVLLETVAAQRLFLLPLKQEMRNRNKFFKIDEVNAGTKESKPARIRGLIPHYANGRIFHRKGLTDLETQLLEFPRNTHDDIIDALSFQIPYWNGPSVSKPKVEDPYMSLNWWKKKTDSNKAAGSIDTLFGEFKRG